MGTGSDRLAAVLAEALDAADSDIQALIDQRTVLAEQQEKISDDLVRRQQARSAIAAVLTRLENDQSLEGLWGRETLREVMPRDQVANLEDQLVSDASATRLSPAARHVVEVLREAPTPLRPAEVLRKFEERGWVEPHWKAPAQSVYGALVRAQRADLVSRNEDGRWQIAARGVANAERLIATARKAAQNLALSRGASPRKRAGDEDDAEES